MPRFRPGIRSLLIGGMVLVIAGLMAITTFVDVERQRATERKDLEERGLLLANTLDSVLIEPLRSGDTGSIGNYASAVWAQPDIWFVKVFDRQGNLLFGPGPNQIPAPGIQDDSVVKDVADLHTVRRWSDDGLEVITPITAGATLVGVAQFGFDSARIDDEIRSLTIERIWQTVALALAGVVVSYVVASFFTEPVNDLVRATNRLALGALDTRVGRLRGHEMQELGNSFNQMAAELQDKVSALQESRTRIVKVQEDVRRDIAVHLHGPVQGRLLALKAQLENLLGGDSLNPDVMASLQGIIDEMGRVIQEEISLLSRRLYPAIVRRGIVPSLQSLRDQFESKLDVKLEIDEELGAQERLNPHLIPEQTKLAAYRIADEAFTNVLKHANAHNVTVSLRLTPLYLRLRVRDDGSGFNPEESQLGLGLSVMLDYAEAAGGTCRIESTPDAGTSVVAVLPVQEGVAQSNGPESGNSESPQGTESLP